ncbi:MAG TPA: CPBP family intramembrane glutamic endopeptidase [Propionicimonas sp.]|nr:CPBP family intramembrane glutamic endopeptidase [Propionicimonas sp.]
MNPLNVVRDFFTAALVNPVPRDHSETPEQLVQRRWVSAVTLAIASFLMAWTLRISPGDPAIYAATLALGTTWVVGALLSGKLYLGSATTRRGAQDSRAILQSVLLGLLLVGLFLVAAVIVAAFPALRDPLLGLMVHARMGVLPVIVGLLFLNAVAAELFYRGGLYAATGGPHAVLITTFVFALSTIPTGMPTLVVGAAVLGAVVGLQRRVTGGVLAPIITHITWLTGMVFLLPAALTIWS